MFWTLRRDMADPVEFDPGRRHLAVDGRLIDALFENAEDGVLSVDSAGVIRTCNPAAGGLFECAPGDLLGKPVSVLLPASEASANDPLSAFMAPGSRTGGREATGIRRGGGTFPMQITASRIDGSADGGFLITVRDITRRRLTEDALEEAEEQLNDIRGNMPVVVFQRVRTSEGLVYCPYVSPRVMELLGIDLDQALADPDGLVGHPHPEDRDRVLAAFEESAEALAPLDLEYRVVRDDGETKWLRAIGKPRLMENGDVIWDGLALDVTEARVAAERLRDLAYNDMLTGTLNRLGFEEAFQEVRRRAPSGRSLAVAAVGLVRFDFLNDTLGHAVADDVLQVAARRLEYALGPEDRLARPTGGTFLVLLGGCDDRDAVARQTDALLQRLARPFEIKGRNLDIAAGAGVALFPADGNDAEALTKNATTAYGRVRERGGGEVLFFREEMNARVLQTLALESRLRRAVDNDEFVPYYQAKVDMQSGAIIGMEALARWLSPRHGLIPPGEFITVAEDAGLIGDIGERIMMKACAQVKRWQDMDLRAVPVAVNISARQFGRPERLVSHVEKVLKETGLDPALLEIELTESSLMEGPQAVVEILDDLGKLGVTSSLDDFGTGYSSLSYLKKFPISKLKIDRSFIVDVTRDNNDAAIVKAIIAMAQALRLTVIAEGVESGDQLAYLKREGCHQIQGYLFSPPVSAAEMEGLLAEDRHLALCA